MSAASVEISEDSGAEFCEKEAIASSMPEMVTSSIKPVGPSGALHERMYQHLEKKISSVRVARQQFYFCQVSIWLLVAKHAFIIILVQSYYIILYILILLLVKPAGYMES